MCHTCILSCILGWGVWCSTMWILGQYVVCSTPVQSLKNNHTVIVMKNTCCVSRTPGNSCIILLQLMCLVVVRFVVNTTYTGTCCGNVKYKSTCSDEWSWIDLDKKFVCTLFVSCALGAFASHQMMMSCFWAEACRGLSERKGGCFGDLIIELVF